MKVSSVLTRFLIGASTVAVLDAFMFTIIHSNPPATAIVGTSPRTRTRLSSPQLKLKLNPKCPSSQCRPYSTSHLRVVLDPHSIQSTLTDTYTSLHGILLSSDGLSLADAAVDANNAITTSSPAPGETELSMIQQGNRGLSYYTTLALYALSFPGLWSTIKRSTDAKIKQKTYVSRGEAAQGGKNLRQQAVEIMACKLR